MSESGTDGVWATGETVEVMITFSENIAVDTTGGTPSVGLSLGGTQARSATYLRGEQHDDARLRLHASPLRTAHTRR